MIRRVAGVLGCRITLKRKSSGIRSGCLAPASVVAADALLRLSVSDSFGLSTLCAAAPLCPKPELPDGTALSLVWKRQCPERHLHASDQRDMRVPHYRPASKSCSFCKTPPRLMDYLRKKHTLVVTEPPHHRSPPQRIASEQQKSSFSRVANDFCNKISHEATSRFLSDARATFSVGNAQAAIFVRRGSSASRLNSSKPQLPSGRENRSTHLLCSKFSMLIKTSHDLSMRFDIELFPRGFAASILSPTTFLTRHALWERVFLSSPPGGEDNC